VVETASTVLEVRDLDVWYGSVQVLFGLGLEVGPGEVVAMLGTNSPGKTTLLRAIGWVGRAGARLDRGTWCRANPNRRRRYVSCTYLRRTYGRTVGRLVDRDGEAERERTDERIAEALGEGRVRSLRARGASMSFDDALAVALAELDRVIASG